MVIGFGYSGNGEMLKFLMKTFNASTPEMVVECVKSVTLKVDTKRNRLVGEKGDNTVMVK